MSLRGIRGAITVDSNTRDDILEKTTEMLKVLIEKNDIKTDDIASAIFSVTDDLDAEFPAVAARKIGWIHTPLFCTREIPIKGSLEKCVRILIHINSDKEQKDMVHVYLRDAYKLRADIEEYMT